MRNCSVLLKRAMVEGKRLNNLRKRRVVMDGKKLVRKAAQPPLARCDNFLCTLHHKGSQTDFRRVQADVKDSPITKIFGGMLRSLLRAPGQKDSALSEPFLSLQLDIQVCWCDSMSRLQTDSLADHPATKC